MHIKSTGDSNRPLMAASAVLVTGADGFVGRATCKRLCVDGFTAIAATRTQAGRPTIRGAERTVAVGDIDAQTDWSVALRAVDTVIHLAARAHILRETAFDARAAFWSVNVDATKRLAQVAASSGVRRFLYVSSIGVLGEQTMSVSLKESDPPRPHNLYAASKWAGEEILKEIRGMEIVILRPPLVYGPGVKGNLAQLLAWINRGIPLPLGSSTGLRSLVGVDNLVDIIIRCVTHPAAANQVFNVADGDDVTVARLIDRLAAGMGRVSPLFRFPPTVAKMVLRVLGRKDLAARLFGSLQIDASKLFRVIGWSPLVPVDEGLMRVGAWYRNRTV